MLLLIICLIKPVAADEISDAKTRWAESPHGPLLERILPPTFQASQLPEPGSAGARLTIAYCVQCHNLPNPAMHDAAKWPPVFERMVLRMHGRGNLGALMSEMMAGVQAPSEEESATLLAYLKKHAQQPLDVRRFPDIRAPAGEAFRLACSQCHVLPDPRRHSAREWPSVVARMQENMEWMNRVVGTQPRRSWRSCRSMPASEVSGVALRRRLLLVVAAAMLPVALVSGLALFALRKDQLAQAERASIELSRALSTAVDAELQRSVSVLQVLASAPALDRNELQRLDSVMRRVLADNPDWYSIILADLGGKPLLNARVPSGAKLPPIIERKSFARTVETRQPVVGDLAEGPAGALYVPVRVPVLRNSEPRYVLSAVVRPDGILDVVKRQRVPPDWVVSVFDGNRARVARSRQHAENLGTPPSPSLNALLDRGGDETWSIPPTAARPRRDGSWRSAFRKGRSRPAPAARPPPSAPASRSRSFSARSLPWRSAAASRTRSASSRRRRARSAAGSRSCRR